MSVFFVGCGDTYLDKMWRSNVEHENAIASNAEQIAKLKAQCDTINRNIEAVGTIARAISENDYVVGVSEIENGYKIVFRSGKYVEIFDGHDGKDGRDGEDGHDGKDSSAPVISMQMLENVWYWTLNGNYMKDSDGNMIPVIGENGTEPQVRIEGGMWQVSCDGGRTWTDAGIVNGKDGDTLFSRVDVMETEVVINLSDGSSFTLPLYQDMDIVLDIEGDETGVEPRKEIQINYHIVNAGAGALVTAASDGNYRVRIIKSDSVSGQIVITSPKYYEDGHISIMVSDGSGYTIVKVVNFYKREIRIDALEYTVPPQGGTVSIALSANFEYRLAFQDGDASWLKYVVNPMAVTRNDIIVLHAERNVSFNDRTAVLELYARNDPSRPLKQVSVTQTAAEWWLERNRFMLNADSCSLSVSAVSSSGLSARCEAEWLNVSLESDDGMNYKVHLAVDVNDSGMMRSAEVFFYTDDGTVELGKMTVSQVASGEENPDDMIFKVKAYAGNMYKTVLPLWGEVDCTVDWGDGTELEHVESQYPSHRYAENYGEYVVRVSGTVSRLRSDEKFSPSVMEVIQWGNTGLVDIGNAFENNTVMVKIAGDSSGAFSMVQEFGHAFRGCVMLEDIPDDLLVSAWKAKSVSEMFCDCKAMQTVPEKIFWNCLELENIDGVFSGCCISEIPEKLFWNCSKIKTARDVFHGCKFLKTVPKKLLWNCPDIVDASYMFGYCDNLETFPEEFFINAGKITSLAGLFTYDGSLKLLPADLLLYCPELKSLWQAFCCCSSLDTISVSFFDNNRKLNDTQEMFFCCGLSGESPYTVVNGKKIHLYERVDEPDLFYPLNKIYNRAYTGNNFMDQDSMPENWKN